MSIKDKQAFIVRAAAFLHVPRRVRTWLPQLPTWNAALAKAVERISQVRSYPMAVKKPSRLTDTAKIGRKDRYPSDYGVRDQEDVKGKNRSWSPGDKGQGREGHSKR